MKSNPQITKIIKHLRNTQKDTTNFLQNTCKGLQKNGKEMGIRVNARFSGSTCTPYESIQHSLK
jgi:hypothetical protein